MSFMKGVIKNKYFWMNIVGGIYIMIVGSFYEDLWIMFLGFFNLLYAGYGLAMMVIKKQDAFGRIDGK